MQLAITSLAASKVYYIRPNSTSYFLEEELGLVFCNYYLLGFRYYHGLKLFNFSLSGKDVAGMNINVHQTRWLYIKELNILAS